MKYKIITLLIIISMGLPQELDSSFSEGIDKSLSYGLSLIHI